MKKRKIVSVAVLTVFTAVVFLFARTEQQVEEEVYKQTDILMGTTFTGTVYGGKENLLPGLIEELDNLEKETLSAKETNSEIGKLNAMSGQKDGIAISGKLYQWLRATLDISQKSNGALDPTLGGISCLWDFGGVKERVPEKEKICASLSKTGYEKVSLQDSAVSIPEGMKLDLGAVGKGIGIDYAAAYLQNRKEVKGAVIALGGSIALIGSKPKMENFHLAIADPRGETGAVLGVLRLPGGSFVSTSGDYEKYFISKGKRYHHILNPDTGYPAESGLISVTVVCDNGLESDGLSTACFVLGKEKGMELLAEYEAEGIIVDEQKNVYVTEGLSEVFTLSAEGYKIAE